MNHGLHRAAPQPIKNSSAIAMLVRAKRASHIDPPASSYANMRRARPYRGENNGPGKDIHGELDPTPGIREQPGSDPVIRRCRLNVRIAPKAAVRRTFRNGRFVPQAAVSRCSNLPGQTTDYSITSLVRASKVAGTSRPSALAV